MWVIVFPGAVHAFEEAGILSGLATVAEDHSGKLRKIICNASKGKFSSGKCQTILSRHVFFKGKLFKEKRVCVFPCGVIENDAGVPLISLGLWDPAEKSAVHPSLNEGEGLLLGNLSCEVAFGK